MQSNSDSAPPEVEGENLPTTAHLEKRRRKSVESIPSDVEDDDTRSTENPLNQLVLYKPGTSDTGLEIESLPDSTDHKPLAFPSSVIRNPSRTSPSIGAFTVQCSRCFQWRLIPTKEKYEEIREHILQDPFYCEKAQEWHPNVTCADPPDICQDGSRLWAIDKPNIAQPPPGWERILRIRGEGGSKFADVYYTAPSGKRMRSMVEVQKYLSEHPEYQGINLSKFSFQSPRPLQENYVKKRPARVAAPVDDSGDLGIPKASDTEEVNPLPWVGPDACTELQIGRPGSSASHCETPLSNSPVRHPPVKKKSRPSKKPIYSSTMFNQPEIKLEDTPHSRNGSPYEMMNIHLLMLEFFEKKRKGAACAEHHQQDVRVVGVQLFTGLTLKLLFCARKEMALFAVCMLDYENTTRRSL